MNGLDDEQSQALQTRLEHARAALLSQLADDLDRSTDLRQPRPHVAEASPADNASQRTLHAAVHDAATLTARQLDIVRHALGKFADHSAPVHQVPDAIGAQDTLNSRHAGARRHPWNAGFGQLSMGPGVRRDDGRGLVVAEPGLAADLGHLPLRHQAPQLQGVGLLLDGHGARRGQRDFAIAVRPFGKAHRAAARHFHFVHQAVVIAEAQHRAARRAVGGARLAAIDVGQRRRQLGLGRRAHVAPVRTSEYQPCLCHCRLRSSGDLC
ncbi:conserved hypothetical protein [Ricinus communis]|uniref:Uncharacterized protein n=1 Tax=Ricinus communis TaxID=3988 RepID=B9TAZ1_RICCO|nr:conserved hypothetical protein [Ricinus communis]